MYLDNFQLKLSWQMPMIILALLIPLSIYNSLLFHTIVEGFAIIVAILIFVVAHNTYQFSQSHFLMFLGIGYFWVAILDFCHTISFSNVLIFPNSTVSTTLHFWMMARTIESFVLIAFTFFIKTKINRQLLFWQFGIVFSLFFMLVLAGVLPTLYVEDSGLTLTKIIGEYILIGLLIIAGLRLWKVKALFNRSVYKLLLLSIAMTIGAEASFTLYNDFSGVALIIGHIFKLLSFWLIYIALVESTLKQPFKSLILSTDTFNALPDAITVIDNQGLILHANQSAINFVEQQQNIIGLSVHDVFHAPNQTIEECVLCQSITNKSHNQYLEVQIGKFWYEVTLSALNDWSQTESILHVCRNISLRKEAQNQLQIVDRLYTVLRLTNKAIISSKNNQDLLDSVCHIAVEHGGFSMAWIGMIKDNNVVPVSSAGDTHNYLDNIKVKVDNSVLAKGPIGIAANNQQVAFVNNIETDQSFLPWKESAIKHGFRSIAAIPVIQNKKCIGIFAIYSSQFDAFDGQVLELLGSLSDDISSITTYIRAEEKRQLAEKKLKQLSLAIEQSKSAIIITDLSGKIEYLNPYFSELMGYTETELLNKNITTMPCLPESEELYEIWWKNVKEGKDWHGEVKSIKKDGSIFWALQSISPIYSDSGKLLQVVWTSKDNTELHEANETITQLAYYDALTNLPNRRLFHDRCKQAISNAERLKNKLALLYFDLDNFKNVNDSWGHDFGDELLIHVAKTLVNCVRETDTVTRLGGDEFAIILNNINENTDINPIVKNILNKLNQKNMIENREISIGTSIGISIYPDDGKSINQLMKCADMAMYHAKEKGKNSFQFFEAFLNINAQQRVLMETKIRQALDNNEFQLYYQPQFNIATGELSGVEALIRWFDQDQGSISPNDFIPVAEESRLIIEIGQWVAERACNEFNQLLKQGFPEVKVAINISASQFQQSAVLIETIENALASSKLPSHLLQLELTEGVLIDNVDETISIIDQLRKNNISFAIDDFGTGYSSLSYLKSFPVDIIKIDRSFIRDIEDDLNNRAIITAIIMMSHELGLKVLAEGVENEKQLSFLKKHHCDLVQGYYYAKPMSAKDLFEQYKTH